MSTPNMGLNVPVVGTTSGPQYATDVNNCFTTIDQHDHTPGHGVLITPAAININSDLSFANNRLTLAKSVTFTSQNSLLAAALPDLLSLYSSGVDLYYNDGSGNQVRITQSGGVAGSPGSIANLTSPASASYVSGSQTFVWESAANTPANMDFGSATLRNITANSFGLTVNPPNAMASDTTLTLPTIPVSARALVIDTAGNISPSAVSGTGTTQADVLPGFGLVPSGVFLPYGGTSAPAGYLLCDGTAYLKTSYPNLYTAIGDAFGSPNSSYFNVPDMRGLFIRGVDGSRGVDPNASSRTAPYVGANTGNNVGSYQADAFQTHTHTIQVNLDNATNGPHIRSTSSFSSQGNETTNGVSGRTSTETRPVNLYANYIIKT